jgi:hypothetical protein
VRVFIFRFAPRFIRHYAARTQGRAAKTFVGDRYSALCLCTGERPVGARERGGASEMRIHRQYQLTCREHRRRRQQHDIGHRAPN